MEIIPEILIFFNIGNKKYLASTDNVFLNIQINKFKGILKYNNIIDYIYLFN